MKLALGNARTAYNFHKQRGEEVAMEIVTKSHGLHMLRDDTSPVKQEIRDLRAQVPQVVFAACNNTKNAMEKREGKPVPIITEATIVPAGVVRLMELQDAGYAYVKPSPALRTNGELRRPVGRLAGAPGGRSFREPRRGAIDTPACAFARALGFVARAKARYESCALGESAAREN